MSRKVSGPWALQTQGELPHPESAAREYGQAPELLPVLDLLGGAVVRARAGERAGYAPIRTPLVDGSEPVAVLAALLARTHSRTAYVADLDAILGRCPQVEAVSALARAFPAVALWLDRGFRSLDEARDWAAQPADTAVAARQLAVLGSESMEQFTDLADAADDCVLSLDFGLEGFRGDPRWLEKPEAWPKRVIVMTLARVGSGAGPELDRLQWCLAKAGTRQVFAAGGVRGAADLAVLRALGVAGALVASALHDGTRFSAG